MKSLPLVAQSTQTLWIDSIAMELLKKPLLVPTPNYPCDILIARVKIFVVMEARMLDKCCCSPTLFAMEMLPGPGMSFFISN